MGKKRSSEEINIDQSKFAEPTMFNMTPPDVRRDRTADGNKKARLTWSKAEHRTSLRKLVTLNNTLSDEKKKAVKSMGFGSILQLKMKVIDNAVMGWLIKKFDSPSCVLEVCGKSVHITLDTVKSTLGIPCTSKNFTGIEGSNEGWLRYDFLFKGSEGKIFDLAALELKLAKCASADIEFKVMYMMFLCTTVLLPKYGTPLEFGILNYLVDLDNIHTYNWGGIVLKSLVDGVDIHRRKNMTKVTGCIFLLQVIFVTELASMYPRQGKYIVPTITYIEQWTHEKVNDILRMFAKNTDDTTWNVKIEDNETKHNQQPLSGEATFTSEGISLLQFIADQVQILNGRINNLERRFTSVESAVSRLHMNTYVKPKDNYGSLRQENPRSAPEEGISTSLNKGFTQGKHNIGKDFDSCNPSCPDDTASMKEQQNLNKNFESCNPSSPNPNIKQEKQEILSPRVLNFETPEINEDGSENSKECTNIFCLVCEAMEKDTCFEYCCESFFMRILCG